MSAFKKFLGTSGGQELSPKQKLEQKVKISRANLLLVVVITAFNTLFLFFDSESYFLFSAFLPYYLVLDGLFRCGKLPSDWYEGIEAFEFENASLLTTLTVISVIIILLYAACWFLSKKYPTVVFSVALGLFIIDSLALFFIGGVALSMILDYLFHVWILYYLITGIKAARKLKTIPDDEPTSPPSDEASITGEENEFDLSFNYKVDEPTTVNQTDENEENTQN